MPTLLQWRKQARREILSRARKSEQATNSYLREILLKQSMDHPSFGNRRRTHTRPADQKFQ